VADGEVHIAMLFSPKLAQQHGYLHGGDVTSIVDSARGYAGPTKAQADRLLSARVSCERLQRAGRTIKWLL